MSTLPLEPSLSPAARPASASRRRRVRWLLILMVLLGGGALALSLLVQLARGEIASRLADLAGRYGLALDAGEIDVPLVGGIGLRHVTVTGLADGRPIATLDALETDLSLFGAALGARRPEEITLRGGRAVLRWNDGLVDLVRPAAEPAAAPSGDTRALTIRLEDLALGLELRQTTPSGAVSADALQLHLKAATLARDERRRLTLSASGEIEASGHRGPFAAAFDQVAGTASLALRDGAQLGFDTPLGPVWVALNGLTHSAQAETTLTGLGLAHGNARVALGSLELQHAERTEPDTSPLTFLERASGLVASDLAIERDGDRLTLARAELDLAPGPSGWPFPTRVRTRSIGVTLGGQDQGLRIGGRAGGLELDLAAPATLLAHLEDGSYLEAVNGLRVQSPILEVVLPARPAAATPGEVAVNGQPARSPRRTSRHPS